MKYYQRIGRRFIQVKPLKGMFLNNDGTFTEKKTGKSIGICVHDDFDETIIASLEISIRKASYDSVESACKGAFPFGEGHIPTSNEILMLLSMNVIESEGFVSLWTSDDSGNYFYPTILYFDPAGITTHCCSRNYGMHKVIPFLTIKK